MNSLSTQILTIKNLNFDVCFYNFRKLILEQFSIDDYINKCYSVEFESMNIRATVWKFFFEVLPRNNDLFEWITHTEEKRNNYKTKKKELTRFRNFKIDPLRQKPNNGWNFIQHNRDLKKIIELDIARTFQEYNLFHLKEIKDLLFNVLFVWSSIHDEISYRQGMNDLIAVILVAIYPFYVDIEKIKLQFYNLLSFSAEEILHRLEDEGLNSLSKLSDDLVRSVYIYLNNKDELEADLFYLFEAFMKRGMAQIYFVPDLDMPPLQRNLTKKLELFHTKWNGEVDKVRQQKEEEIQDQINSQFPIQQRINKIFREYLNVYDEELYDHLTYINTEPSIFLQRWLRCALSREFSLDDIIRIWDAIFAYDMEKILNKLNYKASFVFLDYMCTYLIHKQRNDLINNELNTAYEKLLQMKTEYSIEKLIKSTFKIKNKLILKEDEQIMEMSKSMRTSITSSKSQNDSLNNLDNKLIHSKEHEMSFKSTNVSKNSTCSLIHNYKEIKNLEHIYLKYKKHFSLKDSREFLMVIIKLKNKK